MTYQHRKKKDGKRGKKTKLFDKERGVLFYSETSVVHVSIYIVLNLRVVVYSPLSLSKHNVFLGLVSFPVT